MQTELLEKYHPSMLQLLKIQGLGPKTIALIWSAYKVSDVDGVEKLAREGKIRELPRMGEKHEAKLLKAIEDYRRISGRFLHRRRRNRSRKTHRVSRQISRASTRSRPPDRCAADARPSAISTSSSPARPASTAEGRQTAIAHVAQYPPLMDVIASGDNKISFHLRSGMQVDVRLLPPESFGAAMQYFTGSKAHNVALRQRALKMGYTLNEYSLATLEGEKPVAGKTEEEIYAKLKLDYIPPEMRENLGEIDLAPDHALPQLITQADIQGDVHMHTVETDGRNTIEEMAEAAKARGYKYMAITDHSKNLAFANGLDDKRAVEHIARIRAAGQANRRHHDLRRHRSRHPGRRRSRSLRRRARADGHRHRQRALASSIRNRAKMTDRLLKAIENPNTSIIGHPTGRIQLRRDAYRVRHGRRSRPQPQNIKSRWS